jgi:hypothetical protein
MADDYQRFREVLVEMHRAGGTRRDVSAVLPTLTGQKKIALYPKLMEGYRHWSGRKGAEWFEPAYAVWRHGKLGLRVNPELGLKIKGVPHLIKLYFKVSSVEPQKERFPTSIVPGAPPVGQKGTRPPEPWTTTMKGNTSEMSWGRFVLSSLQKKSWQFSPCARSCRRGRILFRQRFLHLRGTSGSHGKEISLTGSVLKRGLLTA